MTERNDDDDDDDDDVERDWIERYYAPLIGKRKLRVDLSETKGKRLLATREGFEKDEEVLRERPLIGLQSVESKMRVPVCVKCFRFVGTAELHYDLLAGTCSRSTLSREDDSWCFARDKIVKETKIVRCTCGECFCSERCRSEDKSHKLLCTGSLEDDHPLVEFKVHAIQTNEIFLLAAKVIASILVRALNNCKNPMEPYQGFVKRLWWDVVVVPAEEEDDEVPLRDVLRNLAQESLDLLRKGLMQGRSEPDSRVFTSFLNLDLYGRVIGMFEQNQISIDVESPLSTLLRETKHEKTKKRLYDLLLSKEEEEEKEFPSLVGMAMFTLTCGTINHSCDPNVSLNWVLDNDNVPCIQLIALKNIKRDDEICFSYIDESMSLDERRVALMDYGFVCRCVKCHINTS
jgi:hypothetical protein